MHDHLQTLSHEQRLQWTSDQVSTYRVGNPIKASMGNIWVYGTVIEVNKYHVAFKEANADSPTYVASPNPYSGLQHISQDELEAARLGNFCDK